MKPRALSGADDLRHVDGLWSMEPPRPPPRSERAATVARWFGLPQNAPTPPTNRSLPAHILHACRGLLPAAGQILLLSGPSGSGKSSLLRMLRRASRGAWIDLRAIRLSDKPLTDCFGQLPLEQVLVLLGRVGLGEAWSYLRTPDELSDGQRWRLRLALAMHRAAGEQRRCLAADEFAALLDRVTALVVARALRRTIDAMPHLSVVLASSHDDLLPALRPDVVARCDFGRIVIERTTPPRK